MLLLPLRPPFAVAGMIVYYLVSFFFGGKVCGMLYRLMLYRRGPVCCDHFFVAGDRTDRQTDRQTKRQNIHGKKRLSRAIPARFAV
jgi:hypothetical protein